MPVENKNVLTVNSVIEYLTNAEVLTSWLGLSPCRICGEFNGSSCLSDGTYQWPEGLVHYVRDHGVLLDQEFIDHIQREQKWINTN